MSVRGTKGPASRCGSVGEVTVLLRNLLDDLDQLVGAIPVMSSKAHDFTGLFEHGIPVGCTAGDGHASAPPKLDEPFVTEGAQCSQDGVVVHSQYSSEIPCGGKAFTRQSITISDGSSYLSSHLLMERCAVRRIDPGVKHDTTEHSPIISRLQSVDGVSSHHPVTRESTGPESSLPHRPTRSRRRSQICASPFIRW